MNRRKRLVQGVVVALAILLAACRGTPSTPAGEEGLTGNAELDAVIAAVMSDDPSLLRRMIEYTPLPCMTVGALGGPPPCREGESEGTLVEVLPGLSSEASYLRREDVDTWPGLDVTRLVAAYSLSDQVFADESFPAGDYGLLFAGASEAETITVHVRDGAIVRIDYHMGASLEEVLAREADEILLGP